MDHTPLITPSGRELLGLMTQHPHAPRWNYTCGDRMDRDDLAALDVFREALGTQRTGYLPGPPPASVRQWVQERRPHVPFFQERLPVGFDLEGAWAQIVPMTREDVAVRVDRLVADDADLERMMVYETAGTTGHALVVPKDIHAVAAYLALMELSLAHYRVALDLGPDRVANFLVGAQARTATYASIFSAWQGAGHAKLNFHPAQWRAEDDPHHYFEAFDPPLVTGDPISFSEMLRLDIPAHPRAIVSTAVSLSDGLRERLAARYNCPVIDWYSANETGPIAYSCPLGHGHHVLAHDLFVEILDADGQPTPPGVWGEITLTGGRNVFLPLLRYRTGDWGRLDHTACLCGDPMPRIFDLEGRPPVLFRDDAGTLVNPVDVSRILKHFPIVQHTFRQHTDLSYTLTIRPVGPGLRPDTTALEAALRPLLGNLPLRIAFDPHLGADRPGGKVVSYGSELPL